MPDSRSGPGPDLYTLLGVAPTADAAEIALAYRRRLREVHPDTAATAASGAGGTDPPAELRALQEAYLVLRDPARRARYDAEHLDRHAPEPGQRRGLAIPVRVRSRPVRARDRMFRAGPVRWQPLPPRPRRGSSPPAG